MAPSIILNDGNATVDPTPPTKTASTTSVLHRSLHRAPLRVISASGLYLTLDTGQRILDATGGAAVACLGHGNTRVNAAIARQMSQFSYVHSMVFSSGPAEELAKLLTESTHGHMTKAFIVSSGSEAMEAAMKLARQYFLELPQAQTGRVNFIARKESYHGNTLGALSVSGHVARRKLFEPMLLKNVTRVSWCNGYRGMVDAESEEGYVQRLKQELDDEFVRVGPSTVCAFVAEPVVGAALGCVPAVSGYFKAMKEVCDKYGALLILDEVMCGMGRTGTLHAWEQEDVVPDIQTIGKGLGGGYAPVAGLLVNKKIVDALDKGTGAFAHGQTYQGHPIACAAALEVLRIINGEDLLENVRRIGSLLESLLMDQVGEHPHVGNVRGRGLFWGIEFVQDKKSKTPFHPTEGVATGIHELALEPQYSISLYPGNGSVDGVSGDHVLLAPSYNVTVPEIREIAALTTAVIKEYFGRRRRSG